MDISRRPPIGNGNNTYESPIVNYKHESVLKSTNFEPKSEDESDHVDSDDETDKSTEEKKNITFGNCVHLYVYIASGVLIIVGVLLYIHPNEQNKVNATASIKNLMQKFPSQVEDFWLHIEEGVGDIKQFHKPRTFIFLYTKESQETLEKILNRVVEFATCTLTYCAAVPIILKANELKEANILKDYGEIITRNKERLEESGVMVIENLENVPGLSAQAFHSFCDEYNPVVSDALFIFTMKVDEFHDNDLHFIEKYLRNRWNDITDDHFYPLFTRIVNVVLPIMAEK